MEEHWALRQVPTCMKLGREGGNSLAPFRALCFHGLAARLLFPNCGFGPQTVCDDRKRTQGVFVENVLILDDDPAILHGIADVLRLEHYSILEASTSLQAIETGRECGRLSLFVTDIELPDASGIEIAIKLVGSHPDLPVLVISGNPMNWWTTSDVSNFSRFSPNKVDFLEKPFFSSELKMRVRNLIRDS